VSCAALTTTLLRGRRELVLLWFGRVAASLVVTSRLLSIPPQTPRDEQPPGRGQRFEMQAVRRSDADAASRDRTTPHPLPPRAQILDNLLGETERQRPNKSARGTILLVSPVEGRAVAHQHRNDVPARYLPHGRKRGCRRTTPKALGTCSLHGVRRGPCSAGRRRTARTGEGPVRLGAHPMHPHPMAREASASADVAPHEGR
jgi:hypothetical protein